MEGLYSHMSLTAPSLSRCSFHSTLSSGVSPACMSIRSLSIPTGGSLFAGVPPPSLVRLCVGSELNSVFFPHGHSQPAEHKFLPSSGLSTMGVLLPAATGRRFICSPRPAVQPSMAARNCTEIEAAFLTFSRASVALYCWMGGSPPAFARALLGDAPHSAPLAQAPVPWQGPLASHQSSRKNPLGAGTPGPAIGPGQE